MDFFKNIYSATHKSWLFCGPTDAMLVAWNRQVEVVTAWKLANTTESSHPPNPPLPSGGPVVTDKPSHCLCLVHATAMWTPSFSSKPHSRLGRLCDWTDSLAGWSDWGCLLGSWRMSAKNHNMNLSRVDTDLFLAVIRTQEPLPLEDTMSSVKRGVFVILIALLRGRSSATS